MKKILLFPFNGNAREAISIINAANAFKQDREILGFIDDDPEKLNLQFATFKVIGNRQRINDYPDSLILAVPGRPETFLQRDAIIQSLGLPRHRFETIIHPSVSVGSECRIGTNCLLMQNVVLTAAVVLGDNIIILPNTVIAHESSIADNTIIGSNVTISGSVKIGKQCYIGSGTKCLQEITIGEKSLVGLGSVVIRDVPAGSVVAGNPAKVIRKIL
jgi:sugar O-acyltransferase (sialic acid O-acetyltransferase NeuD family)